jgi:uncharacterized membrane protein YcaP (DUF421 family)
MIGSAPVPVLLALCVRTAVVLLWVVGGLRLLGKRQLGQLNVYDLAMVMAVANGVQNAMTAGRGELAVGLVSAGTLLLVGRVFVWLFVRLPRLEERLVGVPTILVNDGHLLSENMRRECISEAELCAAARIHGLTDPRDAKLIVLEVDGTLSVVPKDAPSSRTARRYGHRPLL